MSINNEATTLKDLFQAVQSGNLDQVKMLVRDGVAINDTGGIHSCTALHWCAERGELEICRYLLKNGAKLNIKDDRGFTPLLKACMFGHISLVTLLVESGSDITQLDGRGCTTLHLVAQMGHIKVCNYLLSKHVPVNVKDNKGYTPLLSACYYGKLDVVRCLLGAGSDITATDNKRSTALHLAAQMGHKKVCKYLLEQCSLLDDMDDEGFTPLSKACLFGHLSIVQYFVTAGSNVNQISNKGVCAIHAGASGGHVDTVNYLISEGANVEVKDKDGNTALFHACSSGHVDVVKILVSKGLDVLERNEKGQSAFNMAFRNRQTSLFEYVEKNLHSSEILQKLIINRDESNLWMELENDAELTDYMWKCLDDRKVNPSSHENVTNKNNSLDASESTTNNLMQDSSTDHNLGTMQIVQENLFLKNEMAELRNHNEEQEKAMEELRNHNEEQEKAMAKLRNHNGELAKAIEKLTNHNEEQGKTIGLQQKKVVELMQLISKPQFDSAIKQPMLVKYRSKEEIHTTQIEVQNTGTLYLPINEDDARQILSPTNGSSNSNTGLDVSRNQDYTVMTISNMGGSNDDNPTDVSSQGCAVTSSCTAIGENSKLSTYINPSKINTFAITAKSATHLIALFLKHIYSDDHLSTHCATGRGRSGRSALDTNVTSAIIDYVQKIYPGEQTSKLNLAINQVCADARKKKRKITETSET